MDRYLWLVFIAFATAFVVGMRTALGIKGNRSAFAALILVNSPWLLEGYGMLVNPRPADSFELFAPASGWVAPALIGSIAANWVALLWWLFMREGAERLAACPAALKMLNLPENAGSIKLLAVACIIGGVLGVTGIVVMHRQ